MHPTDINGTDINTTVYHLVQTHESLSQQSGILAMLAIYFGIFVLFRYRAIMARSVARLQSEQQMLRARLSNASSNPEEVKAPLQILDDLKRCNLELSFLDKWLVNSGKILSGWRMLHEAWLYTLNQHPVERIREELHIVRSRLAKLDKPAATALAEEIDAVLKGNDEGRRVAEDLRILHQGLLTIKEEKEPEAKILAEAINKALADPEWLSRKAPPKPSETEERLYRSLLKEGMRLYYEDRDDYFEMLADWQNRGVWLTYAALLCIMILAFTGTNPLILIAGGIGGLLSRLRSAMKSKPAPSEYGLSWTPLFLTPLVGVLTGWAGTIIFIVLVKVQVFSQELIGNVHATDDSTMPVLMMIAIACGYSATFFEKMISRVEEFASQEKQRLESDTAKKEPGASA